MKLSAFISCVGKPFSYYPRIAARLGSVDAAVLLCAIIWRDIDRQDDKFLKTIEQLQAETGLTERSMRTARELLEESKILKSEYLRSDHITSFEVDLDKLEEFIRAPDKTSDEHLTKRQMPPDKTSDEHLTKRQVAPLYENKYETTTSPSSEEIHFEMDLVRWMAKSWSSAGFGKWAKLKDGTERWLRNQEAVLGPSTYRENWLSYLRDAHDPHVLGFIHAMEDSCKGRPRPNGNGHFKPNVPPPETHDSPTIETGPSLPDGIQQMREERGEEWYKDHLESRRKERERREAEIEKGRMRRCQK